MNGARLLLDAGNTRLKWAVTTGENWQAYGAADYADLSAIAIGQPVPLTAYVASVTHRDNEARLRAWCDERGFPVRWLFSGETFGDVRNGYAEPASLGVDRWMALISARARSAESVLVVSAGTAVTIDALSAQGDFLGGLILPGMALMRAALAQGTARVAVEDGTPQDFPRCTEDAVESGVLAALCGAIRTQHTRLAARSAHVPCCMVTGGDATRLLPHLGLAAEHVPNLVLEGIDCVAGKETRA